MGGSGHFARLAPFALALAAIAMSITARADVEGQWRLDAAGRAQMDIHYDCTGSAPTAALAAAGVSIGASVKLPPLCVVEGWADPADLAAIAAVSGVTAVGPPAYAEHRQPLLPAPARVPQRRAQKAQGAASIDANGVSIMHADQFVALGTSGSGVLVGVQSTGVTSLATIQGRGELPGNVQVLAPAGQVTPPVGDEGTALMEEVHAVAPGAGLAFCGPNTFVEYTSCLGQLIAAGATVLVDDIIFPGEDVMSTNSANAQAIGQLLTQNPAVLLFTSAGNYTGSYWEGAYTPVQSPLALSCTSNGTTQTDSYVASFGGTPYETLKVSSDSQFPVTLAWDDPAGQNSSNFDLYWYSNGTQVGCLSAAGSGQSMIVPQTQGAPGLALPAGSYQVYIATPDASLANKYLKLWAGGDGVTTLSVATPGAIASTQALAPGVSTIGAVNGSDGIGDTIEYFSSLGPLYAAFPAPVRLQAPTLVAPDGISVDASGTYFQGFLFPDGNFYGTSASVPNVGGVAALIRGAFPNLSATEVLQALEQGATPLGNGTPNATYGFGRVDAMGALGTFPAPTLTASIPDSTIDPGKSTPAYPITVSGFGTLHFTATSSNPSLIPGAVVPAGSAGITIAPSTCGSTTLTCTVWVTAASGQYGGNVTVTVSALDGADRAAAATMTVTVSGPPAPPPAPPSTVTVSSSSGGGGELQWWEIVTLAGAAVAESARRRIRTGRPQ